MRHGGSEIAVISLGLFLIGCSKTSAPESAAKDQGANNAFTHMVDSGVSTINNAHSAVDTANQLNDQQVKEANEAANQ
jgi:hypothetical protein